VRSGTEKDHFVCIGVAFSLHVRQFPFIIGVPILVALAVTIVGSRE
jgi:hypothetical protein